MLRSGALGATASTRGGGTSFGDARSPSDGLWSRAGVPHVKGAEVVVAGDGARRLEEELARANGGGEHARGDAERRTELGEERPAAPAGALASVGIERGRREHRAGRGALLSLTPRRYPRPPCVEATSSPGGALVGRAPIADDLIVPLPPDAAGRRRSRTGLEPFRGTNYSGNLWRETDLPALGWRHRRHYDMRATFITLAIEDGADPEILENRVTHTRQSRSAFDGYNRGHAVAADVRRGGEAADRARRAPRGDLGRRRVGSASRRCSVCKL
jgi:hypothetical protein